MACKTIRDVLEQTRAFHRELGALYHRLSDASTRERVRLLLDYLAAHEEKVDEGLARFEREAGRGVRDTWLRYVPDKATWRDIETVVLAPDMPFEEILGAALALNNCLMELYEECLAECDAKEAKAFFKELLDWVRRDDLRMVRDAVELEDV